MLLPRLLQVVFLKQSLETDVVRIAEHRRFVWARLDLLWFLGGKWISPTVPDVHLQLGQDLERGPELCLAVHGEEGRDVVVSEEQEGGQPTFCQTPAGVEP